MLTPPESAPVATPRAVPADEDALLRQYLVARDAFCSTCGYNLRDLAGATCPECGERLRLRVGREPSAWPITRRAILHAHRHPDFVLGLGLAPLILVGSIPLVAIVGSSVPIPRFAAPPAFVLPFILAFGWGPLAVMAGLWWRRRPLLRERGVIRWLGVGSCWLVAMLVLAIFSFAFFDFL